MENKNFDKILSNIPDYFYPAFAGELVSVFALPEIAAAIDKDGIVRDCVKDPNGNLFEIKNLIAIGNKVEP